LRPGFAVGEWPDSGAALKHGGRAPRGRRDGHEELDLDRETGVIRSSEHAFSRDGGLAVLKGNLAEDGCIVKTAGVDEGSLVFAGPARVFESQDAAVSAILTGKVQAGDVVVIRYEGPRGGPGMQEMLYPTSYLKSKGLEARRSPAEGLDGAEGLRGLHHQRGPGRGARRRPGQIDGAGDAPGPGHRIGSATDRGGAPEGP
jgi:hypothetical protein